MSEHFFTDNNCNFFAKIKIIICIKARGGEHRGGVFRTIVAFELDMN